MGAESNPDATPSPGLDDRADPLSGVDFLAVLEAQLATRGERICALREDNRRLRQERDSARAELRRQPYVRLRRAVSRAVHVGRQIQRQPGSVVDCLRRGYWRVLRRLGRR